MSEIDVITTCQIAAGQSLSAEVDIGTKSLVGILVPANWTTAGISLQASPDAGVTFGEVTNVAGTPYAIGSLAGGTLVYYVAVDPTVLRGCTALKIRSGTQTAPVNQVNLVTFQLITRLVF